MKKKLHPVLGSSTDPTKLAMTWKGVAVGVIPFVILLAGMFGVELDSNDLVNLVDAALALMSSAMVAFGLARKLYLKFKK